VRVYVSMYVCCLLITSDTDIRDTLQRVEKVSNFVEEIKISNWLINQSINYCANQFLYPANILLLLLFLLLFRFHLTCLPLPPSYLFIFIKVLILHVIYQLTITRLSCFVSLFYNWNHPIQIRWLLLLLLLLFSIILQLRI